MKPAVKRVETSNFVTIQYPVIKIKHNSPVTGTVSSFPHHGKVLTRPTFLHLSTECST